MRIRRKLATVFAITLVLAIIVTMLPSCGGKTEETQKTPTTSTSQETKGVQTNLPPITPTQTQTSAYTQTPTPIPTTTLSYSTSSSVIQMVSINGGTFSMGSNNGDSDEKPVHQVTLSPFTISQCEITYAQWVKVRDWGKSHGYSFNHEGFMGSEYSDYYGRKQDENCPVTDIEWYDAVLWCNALSEMEGRTPCYYTSAAQSTVYRSGRTNIQNGWVKWNANGYRLPAEAEWEYACRAGTTTKYSFGDSISGEDANYWDSYRYANGTTPVGSYAANQWGLYDMHGNVWEWCWDWYSYSYGSGAVNNPHGPSSGSDRVYRGGGWDDNPEYLGYANRTHNLPDYSSNFHLGFRPVISQ